jgi:ARC6-like, IMS domain
MKYQFIRNTQEYMHRYVIVILLLLSFVSCNQNAKEDERLLIKNVIISYATELEKSYQNYDLNLLPQITTKNELKRIEALIQVLRRNKQHLSLSVEKLQIEAIHFKSRNEAESDTMETWKYSSLPMSSANSSSKPTIQKYNVHYSFQKEQGIWKIDKVQMHGIKDK